MEVRETWQRVVGRAFRRKPEGRVPPRHEVLLQQMQAELRDVQMRYRQKAVETITTKNNLQQQVNDLQARVDNLNNKALLAETRGDEEMALSLTRECDSHTVSLALAQEKILYAQAEVENLKKTVWREEEAIRLRSAEAYLISVEWTVSYLQKGIAETLHAYSSAPVTPANRDKRCRALLDSITKHEAEFADVLRASEASVATLHENLREAREKNDRTLLYDLRDDLELEETALTLLQEAHAKARDVRLRVERWAAIGMEDTAKSTAEESETQQ